MADVKISSLPTGSQLTGTELVPVDQNLNGTLTTIKTTTQAIADLAGASLVGPQGPIGPTGPQGPAGAVGPAGLTWKGQWVSGTSYVANDAVGYNGASYFCILATSGTTNPTANTTNWALLASQGAQGPTGPTGPQGPIGPAGAAGWELTGNSGTSAATNFIGTTDNVDLIFKRWGNEGLRLPEGGGIDTPSRIRIRDNANNITYAQLSQVSSNGRLILNRTGNNASSTITCANITGSRTLQLPDANGTLVTSVNNQVPDVSGNVTITGTGSGWSLTGNGGTNSSTNFIGTTDSQSLVFKVANTECLKITTNLTVDTPSEYRVINSGIVYVKLGNDASAGRLSLINTTNAATVDLKCTNITAPNKVLQLPNVNGTLATTDDVGTKTIKVSLTSSQLLNLHTTPIDLVVASSGKSVLPIQIIYKFNKNTTAYSGGVNIQMTYNTSSDYNLGSVSLSAFGNNSFIHPENLWLTSDLTASSINLLNNKIYIKTVSPIINGNGTLDIYLTYAEL